MAYDPLLTAEIQAGKPVTTSLFNKIKGNFDFFNSIISSASDGLQNGSFETAGDTEQDASTWERTAYTGGIVERFAGSSSEDPGHGAYGAKCVHPGGSGNGGGVWKSDYVAWDEYRDRIVSLLYKASVSGQYTYISIFWYDEYKVALSPGSTAVYTQPDSPTSWTPLYIGINAPAGTRYVKISLAGGFPSGTTAGTTYFDGVDVLDSPPYLPAPLPMANEGTFAYGSTSSITTSWVNLTGATFSFNQENFGGEMPVVITIPDIEVWGYAYGIDGIYDPSEWRISFNSGAYYSNTVSGVYTSLTAVTFTLNLTAAEVASLGGGTLSAQLQARLTTATGGPNHQHRKLTATSTVLPDI